MSVFKLNQTCFVESFLVMRYGFLSATRKPCAKAVSGNVRHRWGRRKQDSQSRKAKSCWSRSSMCGAQSTASSCLKVRGSISNTKRSLGKCIAEYATRDKNCGRTNNGCFFTSIHLLTMPRASDSSQPSRNITGLDQSLYSSYLVPYDFFFFSRSKGSSKGTRFKIVEAIKGAVKTELMGIREESLQGDRAGWESALDSKRDYLQSNPFRLELK